MSVTPIKPPEQGSHFWFMSIQTPNAQGVYLSSHKGHVNPWPGETRYDLFLRLLAECNELDPRTIGGLVIAFDVQPNQI